MVKLFKLHDWLNCFKCEVLGVEVVGVDRMVGVDGEVREDWMVWVDGTVKVVGVAVEVGVIRENGSKRSPDHAMVVPDCIIKYTTTHIIVITVCCFRDHRSHTKPWL